MTARLPRHVAPLASGEPTSLGPYQLLGRLDAGITGIVYLSRAAGGAQVAIRALHPGDALRADMRARFAAAIDRARALTGPHTCGVLDATPDADRPYVVTEFVGGPTLAREIVERGPLSTDETDRLARTLLATIEAAHRTVGVHGDLTATDIVLSVTGPRLVDLGIAASLRPLLLSTGAGPARGGGGPRPAAAARDAAAGGAARDAAAGWAAAPGSADGPGYVPGYGYGPAAGGWDGPAADIVAWAGIVDLAATGKPSQALGPTTRAGWRRGDRSEQALSTSPALRRALTRVREADGAALPDTTELLALLAGAKPRSTRAARPRGRRAPDAVPRSAPLASGPPDEPPDGRSTSDRPPTGTTPVTVARVQAAQTGAGRAGTSAAPDRGAGKRAAAGATPISAAKSATGGRHSAAARGRPPRTTDDPDLLAASRTLPPLPTLPPAPTLPMPAAQPSASTPTPIAPPPPLPLQPPLERPARAPAPASARPPRPVPVPAPAPDRSEPLRRLPAVAEERPLVERRRRSRLRPVAAFAVATVAAVAAAASAAGLSSASDDVTTGARAPLHESQPDDGTEVEVPASGRAGPRDGRALPRTPADSDTYVDGDGASDPGGPPAPDDPPLTSTEQEQHDDLAAQDFALSTLRLAVAGRSGPSRDSTPGAQSRPIAPSAPAGPAIDAPRAVAVTPLAPRAAPPAIGQPAPARRAPAPAIPPAAPQPAAPPPVAQQPVAQQPVAQQRSVPAADPAAGQSATLAAASAPAGAAPEPSATPAPAERTTAPRPTTGLTPVQIEIATMTPR